MNNLYRKYLYRIYLCNLVVLATIILVNIYIRSLNEIQLVNEGQELVLVVSKSYEEYFRLITILSILSLFLLFIINIFMLYVLNKRYETKIKNFSNKFKNRPKEYIVDIPESSEEAYIIEAWNNSIKRIKDETKLRDTYFKMMIHDFKMPLHLMKSSIDLYEIEYGSNEYIDSILEEISNFEDQVTKFLVLEKINYFEKPEYTEVCITDLAQKIIDRFQSTNVELLISAKSGDESYMTDYRMLKKIINNLIENAIKYSVDNNVQIEFYANRITVKNSCNNNAPTNNIYLEGRRLNSGFGNGLGVLIIDQYAKLLNIEVVSKVEDSMFIVNINL